MLGSDAFCEHSLATGGYDFFCEDPVVAWRVLCGMPVTEACPLLCPWPSGVSQLGGGRERNNAALIMISALSVISAKCGRPHGRLYIPTLFAQCLVDPANLAL